MHEGPTTRTAAIALIPAQLLPDLHLMWPVVSGLIAVFTARAAFNDREADRTGKPQTFRKTLPVTGAAALLEIAFITMQNLNVPWAIFYGLGIGWVTVLLLDLLGDRLTDVVRAMLGGGVKAPVQKPFIRMSGTQSPGELTDEQKSLLHDIDVADDANQQKALPPPGGDEPPAG